MKENHSSDEENDISGDQPGINFVKDDTFENILDMSVIENMKKNKTLLTTDKMNQVIERYIAAKKKDPNANIIDEDFLHLVWSICKMKKLDPSKDDNQQVALINNILSTIRQNFAYEFLLCCYKLDLSPKSLAGFWGIDDSASYINELCNDTELKGNNLIKMAFLTNRKSINVKWLCWLEENGYFHDSFSSSNTLKDFMCNQSKMNKIIKRCIEAKGKDPNANIIDEDFLRLVWSICKMDKIDEEEFDKQCQINDILSQIGQNFAYEFLLCCYKLGLGPKTLHFSSYLYELCQDSVSHSDGLIKRAFLQGKKPINIKFLYWLEESGYFDKSCSSITLENFIKKRTEQNIGNYEFDSYDEFNQFIGKKKKEEEKEKEKKNEKYEGASVYVTELLKVLKKENKFLEPAELEELAKGEYKLSTEGVQGFQYTRICLKKPQDLTEDDIADWLSQDALYVNKMGISNDKKIYRRQAREKYWAYVKCIFFGNAEGDIRGLFNTKALSDEVIDKILKSILRYSSGNYSFLNIEGVADEEDIFQRGENISWFIDDVKELRNQLLSKYKVSNTEELHNQFLSKGNSNSMLSNKKVYQKENSTRRIVSGAILLVLGIIGCGVVLGIGLASKLAVALLFLFVFMTITGALCLFWKKISGCLNMCCPKISGLPDHQKPNYKEYGQFIDQTYPGSNLGYETDKNTI